MLEARELVVRYRGRTVVDQVSLRVPEGEVVGLLGPNGAGKTSCFRAILGQVDLGGGQVLLDGQDITRLPMHQRARRGIGYLPQEASVFRDMDVAANIRCVLETRSDLNRSGRRRELDRLLHDLQITRVASNAGHALSGGQRRRVELARALAAQPRYMLLDEPFAGVDPVSVGEIRELVSHLTTSGIGVLITDHNVREALKLCDRVYALSEGSLLASGTPDEIVEDPRVRGVYLGEGFSL
jgi:lipopolysaccharide export system ATP-binding protein